MRLFSTFDEENAVKYYGWLIDMKLKSLGVTLFYEAKMQLIWDDKLNATYPNNIFAFQINIITVTLDKILNINKSKSIYMRPCDYAMAN